MNRDHKAPGETRGAALQPLLLILGSGNIFYRTDYKNELLLLYIYPGVAVHPDEDGEEQTGQHGGQQQQRQPQQAGVAQRASPRRVVRTHRLAAHQRRQAVEDAFSSVRFCRQGAQSRLKTCQFIQTD